MSKKVDSLKEQMTELSSILNLFKSEAVQLRILDLLFSNKSLILNSTIEKESKNSGRKPGRPKNEKVEKKLGFKNKKRRTDAGPTFFLKKIETEKFFSQPRSIGDIVKYCNTKYGQTFKSTDFSAPLVKFVTEKILKKNRSKDGKHFVFGK